MKLKERIKNRFVKLDRLLSYKLRNVSLPGFRKKSLYEVSKFFFRSFFEEDQSLRASALAFNFFLALFPTIIFLFTLIAYIPIADFHDEIVGILEVFLPPNAFELLLGTINDILKNQNAGLLSFGFIAALYFASNGFANMISAFDLDVDRKFQRNWFNIRLKSFGLTFLVTSLLVTSIVVSISIDYSIWYLAELPWIKSSWIPFILKLVEYVIVIALVYFIFSSLYYFGSSKVSSWKFFSPGSTLATFLSLLTTYAFTLYVENFNSYNKLYGSIGTILVIMVLIFFISFVVLIGFELNKSIDKAD
ncbi:MAG: YihY/virulence factor BrkB family protein [Bacteroidia bacterium]